MKLSRVLLVLALYAVSARMAAAGWTVYRAEGRDYVSLEEIASFYGFPKPPARDAAAELAAHATLPAPASPASSIAGGGAAAAAHGSTPPAPIGPGAGAIHPAASPTPAAPAAAFAVSPAPVPGAIPPAVSSASAAPTAARAASPTPPAAAAAARTRPKSPAEEATQLGLALAELADTSVKPIILDSGSMQLEVTPGLREARINGVKQWLAFPVRDEGGKVLVSRLDLSKVIEPHLRPEMIEGFQPVTTVVLDPGHGGHDNGATSRFGFEKNFALDVALRARTLLEKQGYKVVMTRSTDVFIPLEQRPAVANHIANSIFVSIHFNSSSSNADARGFEIYSMAPRGAPATNDILPRERDMRMEPGNAMELQSCALAGSVFNSLIGQVPMEDRGIKFARFAVLRLCAVPAVLIECGFVSNNAESVLIDSGAWRDHVAGAIADGVDAYKLLAERKQRPKVVAEYRAASGMLKAE